MSSQGLQEGFWFTALYTLFSPTPTDESRQRDSPTKVQDLDNPHSTAAADQNQETDPSLK